MDSSPATANTADEKPLKELRLPSKVEDMLKVGFMVDCKFIVGPKAETAETIFGHKWMFAVESIVFERMFCGDFMEAKNCSEIRLPDDDPNAFRNLRRLLYNLREARVEDLSMDDTISLYKLCDKYMVETISKLCAEHLKSFLADISDEQLITLFAVAIELGNTELLDGVKEKLLSRKYPLSNDLNELNQMHFLEYVKLYVEANTETPDHLELFNSIEKYLIHHALIPKNLLTMQTQTSAKNCQAQDEFTFICEERKPELLERLLVCVDFGKITTNNFLAGPGASTILTWQQKYFILSQLCSDEHTTETTIKLFEDVDTNTNV